MLVTSGVVFFAGATLVTVAGNVPLNTALDDSTSAATGARAAFERRWNVLNGVRSASSSARYARSRRRRTHSRGEHACRERSSSALRMMTFRGDPRPRSGDRGAQGCGGGLGAPGLCDQADAVRLGSTHSGRTKWQV